MVASDLLFVKLVCAATENRRNFANKYYVKTSTLRLFVSSILRLSRPAWRFLRNDENKHSDAVSGSDGFAFQCRDVVCV